MPSSTPKSARLRPLLTPGRPRESATLVPTLSSRRLTRGYCSGCKEVQSRGSSDSGTRRKATTLAHWASVNTSSRRNSSRDLMGRSARRVRIRCTASSSRPGRALSTDSAAEFNRQPTSAAVDSTISLSARRRLALLTRLCSGPRESCQGSTLSNSASGSCARRARLMAVRSGTLCSGSSLRAPSELE